MEISLTTDNSGNHLRFCGPMTHPYSRDIENGIISALRRYPHLSVDLSAVNKIDRCGLQLLWMLQSYGGNAVRIVATSPAIDAALRELPVPRRPPIRRRVTPTVSSPLTALFA